VRDREVALGHPPEEHDAIGDTVGRGAALEPRPIAPAANDREEDVRRQRRERVDEHVESFPRYQPARTEHDACVERQTEVGARGSSLGVAGGGPKSSRIDAGRDDERGNGPRTARWACASG